MIAGFVMLIIAMGIGRFSYTSILPLMQSQTHLTATESGYLAGSNNLGYLIAGFGAGFITWGNRRAHHLRIHLILCIISTGLMGITSSFIGWLFLRFIAGISSGLIYVLSSSLVMDALISYKREKWVGFFYGGVGTGIALTGLTTPFLSHFTWRGAWIGFFVVSLILTLPIWSYIHDAKPQPLSTNSASKHSLILPHSIFVWLLVAYGLEGLGYIVSATFLVAMVKQMPNISAFADFSWIVVGLAAVPSPLFWSWWASHASYIKPLITALILQALGVTMPIIMPNIIGVVIGSILFGGTFMGISMLSLAAARMVRQSNSNYAIALMTGFFGIGQIIGPIGAGFILEVAHSYSLALIISASVLALAVIILIFGTVILSKTELNCMSQSK
ncbi:YbfB/YjiJ family MFS transporter [Paenibacillus terrae]